MSDPLRFLRRRDPHRAALRPGTRAPARRAVVISGEAGVGKTSRLGLGRQFFRHQVEPLNTLRNSFGVAHIADPDAPKIVSPSDVERCRQVAARAILAYAGAKDASDN